MVSKLRPCIPYQRINGDRTPTCTGIAKNQPEGHIFALQGYGVHITRASSSLGYKDIQLYSEDTPSHALDDLLKRQDIKAVAIVLPISVQLSAIRRCWAAGKHVSSEKPVAQDV